MIRYVDMSDALEIDGAFAWFDTVTDTFISFAGMEVWYKWDDFADDWIDDACWTLERFKRLYPKRGNE